MAFVLKYHFNQDAIACGWRWNSEETRKMLFTWADFIILMQEKFKVHVPEEFHSKVRVVDVGDDTYGTPMHKDLLTFLSNVGQDWYNRKWEI